MKQAGGLEACLRRPLVEIVAHNSQPCLLRQRGVCAQPVVPGVRHGDDQLVSAGPSRFAGIFTRHGGHHANPKLWPLIPAPSP